MSHEGAEKVEYIIGALSNNAGGVLFNNRVIVSNLIDQGVQVVFLNYARRSRIVTDDKLVVVGMGRFLFRLFRKRPRNIWVHSSKLRRFFFYYAALFPFLLFSRARIRLVLHSGKVSLRLISRFPLLDIHLLDQNLFEQYKEGPNIYAFNEYFVCQLREYLSRESRILPDVSERVADIIRSKKYILTTGYISQTYNFNELIKAHLRDNSADVTLLILSYGEITENRYTREFFMLAEAPPVVHVRDLSRSDYIALLSHSLAMVRATLWDSFGIVMYEANYYNIPVLASRITNYRPDFVRLFELRELAESSLRRIIDKAESG